MTAYPQLPIRYPKALDGTTNGKLPATILRTVPSLHGGKPTVLLKDTAARAFVAMRDAAERAGVRLESVSSYRTYAQQEAIFRERYVPHFARHTDGSVRWKTWNGQRWYHAFGATAAVPGDSNHGRALADDFVQSARWEAWMLDNAVRFGWSWELDSEPWHLRYVAGDRIPQAVLDYEAGQQPPDPPDPDPQPQGSSLVTYFQIGKPDGSGYYYRCVRPWTPHVISLTKAQADRAKFGGAVFVVLSEADWKVHAAGWQ